MVTYTPHVSIFISSFVHQKHVLKLKILIILISIKIISVIFILVNELRLLLYYL